MCVCGGVGGGGEGGVYGYFLELLHKCIIRIAEFTCTNNVNNNLTSLGDVLGSVVMRYMSSGAMVCCQMWKMPKKNLSL